MAEPAGETDDPLGRTFIPLTEDEGPVSNLEAGRGEIDGLDLAPAEEGARAEGELTQAPSSPLVIPAADFRDDGFAPSSQIFWFAGGFHEGTAAGYGCMMAPAYLPSGVQLTELFASVYDNDSNAEGVIWIRLWRVSNLNGAVNVMAEASTAGYPAADAIVIISDLTIEYPDTLYPDYSYYVTTCLPSPALRLYSVRLYYNVP